MAKRKEAREYKWRDGSRRKVAPDAAAAEFRRIKNKYGALKARAVVDESRPEDAPLHPEFLWDDYAAAELYRRVQAQTMIRCHVSIDDEAPDGEYKTYTLATGDDGEASYEDTEIVVSSESLLVDALHRLRKRVAEAEESAGELERLARAHSGDDEQISRIMLISQSLATARAAMASLH